MHQGKSEYLRWISEELETHATVYQSPGQTSSLPSFITNHGLLSQQSFAKLLHRAKVAETKLHNRKLISKDWRPLKTKKHLASLTGSLLPQVFVGLGFPYEGPAPIEAIALGCVLLQPGFNPPHSSDNNDFYKGKPTTRQVWHQLGAWKQTQNTHSLLALKALSMFGLQISSQHPYAQASIGEPRVWTVDATNRTDVRRALGSILRGAEVVNRLNFPLTLMCRRVPSCRACLTVAAVDRSWCLFSQVKPFTPREFTCEGMLERVDAYITHQVVQPHGGNLGF